MKVLDKSPGPLFSLAGFGAWNFDAIARRVGALPEVHPVRSFGKTIDKNRSIFFQFDSGRYAALTKYNSQSEFEIALQRVENCFCDREFALLLDFVGIDESDVQRNRSPPFRFLPHPPSAADRDFWLEHAGSEYPYD